MIYRKVGKHWRAVANFQKALRLDQKLDDRTGEAGDLGGLGLAFAELGKTRRAINYYEQGITAAHDIGDQRREADLLFAMGTLLAKLGNRTSAISKAEEALKIFERIQYARAANVRKQIARWRRRKT
jgi:tetratricopeptide (TPR) repeat protein